MDKKFLKYNLFVSLGEDCACTSYLRDCKLQFASFPFDWLTHASFEKRIELVCNNFKDFLNFNDLYTTILLQEFRLMKAIRMLRQNMTGELKDFIEKLRLQKKSCLSGSAEIKNSLTNS